MEKGSSNQHTSLTNMALFRRHTKTFFSGFSVCVCGYMQHIQYIDMRYSIFSRNFLHCTHAALNMHIHLYYIQQVLHAVLLVGVG